VGKQHRRPALAVHHNTLFLCWTDSDHQRLQLMSSTDNGRTSEARIDAPRNGYQTQRSRSASAPNHQRPHQIHHTTTDKWSDRPQSAHPATMSCKNKPSIISLARDRILTVTGFPKGWINEICPQWTISKLHLLI
jgi:hypothetical protein